MMDNHRYNLLAQIVEDHRSAWRMKKMYKKDAGKCKGCKALYERLAKRRDEDIEAMEKELKKHMK